MKNKDLRRRVLQMVEVGFVEDMPSRAYDYVNMIAILLNLAVCILYTFQGIDSRFHLAFARIEFITVLFFLVDYVLRLWTADLLFPDLPPKKSLLKYVFSFTGIIDLLSFLPYFLPTFFPSGTVAFRLLRVARIFRLFRINAYYDSLNVIATVIKAKSQQLLSSVFIIVVLMMGSSLCMYSLEHEAQPEVFKNAFSGIWWAASTLLTVGYGDIYPITPPGQALGIFITFLGVGMVAIPTGIISAGFVEQYQRVNELKNDLGDSPIHFIRVHLRPKDPWAGKTIADLRLPGDIIVAVVQRQTETIVPRGDVILLEGDSVILGAKSYENEWDASLQEITILPSHPWNDTAIRDLDISRQTFIISVTRGSEVIIPDGNFKLRGDDTILVYTKKKIAGADEVSL